MPRPGQPQQPTIKRGQGPDALAYGAAARVNRLSIPAPFDETEFKPSSPEELFAFAATDFPNEPLTAGVPFGPGPNMVLRPPTSDKDALRRVAERMAALPGQSREVKAFIARVQKGL